ncbi:hypothetical protein BDY24DRAFT_341886, partial [Mrakia frigida]|uniref:uncharacterized protein n=1 Tax=Mrakia frigida TaxID=29902 RepID=UPI003FCC0424
ARKEIEGVLCHEMVHVVQEDGKGSAPGWWIEGLADWIRLEGGLGAKHWKKLGQGSSWKDAYETTALFLSHLTKHVHPSLCSEINARLKTSPWSDGWFEELTNKPIEVLWTEYKAFYAEGVMGVEVPKAVPTHVAKGP